MEVLVSFLGGDPDRPVVLGSLVNATHPHPFALPSATRSGIRTSSTPAAHGYNELSFEDAAGAEEVFMRAERDLRENVQNDRITDVGRDRDTRVARDDHASIEGLRVTRVQGDDILAVQGNLSVNVHGGTSVNVSGNTKAVAEGDHEIVSTGCVMVDAGGGVRLGSEGFISLRVDHEANDGDVSIDVAGSSKVMATREVLVRGDERVRLFVHDLHGDRPFEPRRAARMRARLFEAVSYLDPQGTERGDRYRLANDLAARFAGMLDERFARQGRFEQLLRVLRRFYSAGQCEKFNLARAA